MQQKKISELEKTKTTIQSLAKYTILSLIVFICGFFLKIAFLTVPSLMLLAACGSSLLSHLLKLRALKK